MSLARPFRWTARKEEAAMMVAMDKLTDEAIAAKACVTRDCLEKWKRTPEFEQRIAEITASVAQAVRGRGIADVQNRVDALNERWNLMHKVIEARAVEYAGVPGGHTGLLAPRVRGRGFGGRGQAPGQMGLWEDDADWDDEDDGGSADTLEFAVDVGLLRELREHEKQAAQELGQWQAEREPETTVVIREYVGIDVDKV